jgi:hypothetical protein
MASNRENQKSVSADDEFAAEAAAKRSSFTNLIGTDKDFAATAGKFDRPEPTANHARNCVSCSRTYQVRFMVSLQGIL